MTLVLTRALFAFSLCMLLFGVATRTYAEGDATIRITSNGFEPQSLEISQGQLVYFVNEDEEPHWVASDVHPTHTGYPGTDVRECEEEKTEVTGFDSCRGLFKGSTFSFRFKQAGEWRYHDHLHPEMTGTITVKQTTNFETSDLPRTGGLSLPRKAIAELHGLWYRLFPKKIQERVEALNMVEVSLTDDGLEYWMRVFGYEALLGELQKDSRDPLSRPQDEKSQVTVGECHSPGHFLGRMAFKLHGEAILDERKIDTRCNFGFYHGLVEAALGMKGTEDAIQEFADSCYQGKDDARRAIYCEHVVGHGLVVFYNYDLVTALGKCSELFDYERGRKMCYHGAFMENIVVGVGFGVGDHATEWLDAERPDFPCTIDQIRNTPAMSEMCYVNQTTVWNTNGFSEDAVKGCLRAPAKYRERCFNGIGYDIALPRLNVPDEEVARICTTYMPNAKDTKNCLLGSLFTRAMFWNDFSGFKREPICRALGYEDLDSCDAYAQEELAWVMDPNFYGDLKK